MECDKEHVRGKVVLVQASEGEEDILHLHWYKRAVNFAVYAPDCTTGTIPSMNSHDYWYPLLLHNSCISSIAMDLLTMGF